MKLNNINKSYLIYSIYTILSIMNMLTMHYIILEDKSELSSYSYLYNLFYTLGEVSLLYLLFSFIKHKIFLLIPLFLTFSIEYCNILYYRYFGTYMPFSLYTEFNNLNGLSGNIFEALKLTDILLLLPLICGVLLYRHIVLPHSVKRPIKFYSTGILFLLFSICISYVIEWKADRHVMCFKFERRITNYRLVDPSKSMFELGYLNTLLLNIIDDGNKNNAQHIRPANFDKLIKYPKYFYGVRENRNLIVILVESLLSIHSDMIVNGKEVTPNLNQLKKEGYYHGKMVSEIELGESADGQFIYMTGLLPEKKSITTIDFVDNTYVSIVHQLKKKNSKYTSRMIVPTSATFWRQNEWCENYGIETLISKKDANVVRERWLEDEDIFELAKRTDNITKEPFVSFILTSSTHSPYDELIPCDIKWPKSFPTKYIVYLSKVHYMDRCLGEYIRFLKTKSWYKNTVIVIVSDHHAHPIWFDMEGKVSEYIPLYILNAPIDKGRCSNTKIYQSDLYPTLLDILCVNSDWKGVGQSILMPDSLKKSTLVKDRLKNKSSISTYLLLDDYFGKNKKGSEK